MKFESPRKAEVTSKSLKEIKPMGKDRGAMGNHGWDADGRCVWPHMFA